MRSTGIQAFCARIVPNPPGACADQPHGLAAEDKKGMSLGEHDIQTIAFLNATVLPAASSNWKFEPVN